MNRTLIFFPSFTLLLLLSLFLFGCSAQEHVAEPDSTSFTQTRDTSAMEELYWQRIRESRMNFTDADVEFMTHMIEHHAQALIMSALAPENGANAAVQRLAARIINAQEGEIETMQKWLRDRGQPVPEVHIDELILTVQLVEPEERFVHGVTRHSPDHSAEMASMEEAHSHHDHHKGHHEDHHSESEMEVHHTGHHSGHHHSEEEESHEHEHHSESDHHTHHAEEETADQSTHDGHSHGHHEMSHGSHAHHSMPGMLTQEQLNELGAARGTEFDRLFLLYMIEHHEGAVIMVQDLFAADGAALDNESFDLASGIHAEQVTEIERMRLMLEEIPE